MKRKAPKEPPSPSPTGPDDAGAGALALRRLGGDLRRQTAVPGTQGAASPARWGRRGWEPAPPASRGTGGLLRHVGAGVQFGVEGFELVDPLGGGGHAEAGVEIGAGVDA